MILFANNSMESFKLRAVIMIIFFGFTFEYESRKMS